MSDHDARRGAADGDSRESTPNIFEPHWDAEQDRGLFRWQRAQLGRQAGSAQLGASLYELPPGWSTWP